jgi:fumarate hydratase subunit alpha
VPASPLSAPRSPGPPGVPAGAPAWIAAAEVTAVVREMAAQANIEVTPDVVRAFERALDLEASPVGREVISQLLENVRLAGTTGTPTCQDTGMAVVFARLGSRVLVYGGTLREAVDAGVRAAYTEFPLRKSVVDDPFRRTNTRDNTPAILHLEAADDLPPDALELSVLPKGFGAENMSRLHMLPPSAGWEGLLEVVVETVVAAGPNACPPLVVGVGVGGDFELAPYLAKKALLRDVGTPHPDPELARREALLLEAVNATGVGPQGLGGTMTATAVHLEVYATHIASLPVAVNLGCNAYRHRTTLLRGHPHPPDAP